MANEKFDRAIKLLRTSITALEIAPRIEPQQMNIFLERISILIDGANDQLGDIMEELESSDTKH